MQSQKDGLTKPADSTAQVIEASDIPSPTLRRLIEEVRQDKQQAPAMYNRIHNRHNRGR